MLMKDIYMLDFSDSNNMETLKELINSDQAPDRIGMVDENGTEYYLVRNEDNYCVLDRNELTRLDSGSLDINDFDETREISTDGLTEMIDNVLDTNPQDANPEASPTNDPRKVVSSDGGDSSGGGSAGGEEYGDDGGGSAGSGSPYEGEGTASGGNTEIDPQKSTETLPESEYGDCVADEGQLKSAFESSLEMQVSIASCIASLEYTDPGFPGEALDGEACSDAGISKPDYSSIGTAFSSASAQASDLESSIASVGDAVNYQIDLYRAMVGESSAELDKFLSEIMAEKLEGLDWDTQFKLLVNNYDVMDSSQKEMYYGKLTEEEKAVLDRKLSEKYEKIIDQLDVTIDGHDAKLSVLNDFMDLYSTSYLAQLNADLYQEMLDQNRNLLNYGLTEADFEDPDYANHYQELMAKIRASEEYRTRETACLAELIATDDRFKQYEGMTVSDLYTTKKAEENSLLVLSAYRQNQEFELNMIQYDTLKYTQSYANYVSGNHSVSASDLEGYMNPGYYGNYDFSYKNYVKDHPEASYMEFCLACQEIVAQHPGVVCTIDGSLITDDRTFSTLKEVREYQQRVADKKDNSIIPLIDSDRDYYEIYNYLRETDPEAASKFLEQSAVVNKYNGTKDAATRISQVQTLSDLEGLLGVAADALSMGKVTLEGVADGNYDFFEGYYKLFSKDRVLSAQDYTAMTYLSYLEQNSPAFAEAYKLSTAFGSSLPTITMSTLASVACPWLAASTVGNAAIKFGTGLFGALSNAGTTKNQLLSQGYSDSQSILYALTSAGLNVLTNFVGGLTALSPGAESRGALLNMLIQGGLDAGEKVADAYLQYGILGKEPDFSKIPGEMAEAYFNSFLLSGALNLYTEGAKFVFEGIRYELTGADSATVAAYVASLKENEMLSDFGWENLMEAVKLRDESEYTLQESLAATTWKSYLENKYGEENVEFDTYDASIMKQIVNSMVDSMTEEDKKEFWLKHLGGVYGLENVEEKTIKDYWMNHFTELYGEGETEYVPYDASLMNAYNDFLELSSNGIWVKGKGSIELSSREQLTKYLTLIQSGMSEHDAVMKMLADYDADYSSAGWLDPGDITTHLEEAYKRLPESDRKNLDYDEFVKIKLQIIPYNPEEQIPERYGQVVSLMETNTSVSCTWSNDDVLNLINELYNNGIGRPEKGTQESALFVIPSSQYDIDFSGASTNLDRAEILAEQLGLDPAKFVHGAFKLTIDESIYGDDWRFSDPFTQGSNQDYVPGASISSGLTEVVIPRVENMIINNPYESLLQELWVNGDNNAAIDLFYYGITSGNIELAPGIKIEQLY